MKKIHPVAARIPSRGIVAIELRGGGLNDSHFPPRDKAYLPSRDGSSGRLADVRAAGADGLSQHALQKLAIVNARDWIFGPESRPTDAENVPEWARGRKGFDPFDRQRPPDLEESIERDRHQNRLLTRFHLGGIQTEYLVRLVRQIRSDGFEPVAYLMPVTDIHRGFFEAGGYADLLRHVAAVAESEGFAFVDLDSGHGFEYDAFHDTHHLTPETAVAFSARFAERVLLPHLGDAQDADAVVAAGRAR
jgi:hypothetical protein